MSLLARASAAWEALWGGQPVTRGPELADLPLQRRAGPAPRATSFQFLPSIATRKGTRPGTWDLLEAYNEIPALRTCVDLLAPAAARIQYEIYRVRRPAERRHFERLARTIGAEKERLRRAMVDAGDLEPMPDHPAALFLRRGAELPALGFPILTSFDAKTLTYKYLLLSGEGFEIIERRGVGGGRSKRGEPWGKISVAPTDVRALPTLREPWYVIRDADGLERDVPAEDVLYRREVNPRDPYNRGTGPAHALGTEIEIDRLQSNAMADSWAAGTVPPVLIVGDFAGGGGVPGASPTGPFGLTEEEAGVKTKRMLLDWKHAVDRNRPYFLDGVDSDGRPNVTVHDLSRTMQQMEAQAARSATWSNIARVIGRIPPELRGDTGNSNRATAQAAWYLLQTGYLLSVAEQEAAFIRERILPEWGDETLEVDFVSPVDRDFDAELRVMQSRPQAFMLDEYRKRAGEEELPGGKGKVFVWSPADVPVRDPTKDPFSAAPGGVPKDQEAAEQVEPGGAAEAEGSPGGGGDAEADPEQIEAAVTGHYSVPDVAPHPGEDQGGAGKKNIYAAAGKLPAGQEVDGDGDESAGEKEAAARPATHALLPVPGQDQLDAEAALGEEAGVRLDGREVNRGGPVDPLREVGVRTGAGQRGMEGAVVEVGDREQLRDGGVRGFEKVDGFHADSVPRSRAEVNRAAAYITLDRIALAMEPRLRDLLLSTLERARSRVSEAELVQAIEARNLPRVVDLLGGEELARDMRRAQGLVAEVFKAAGAAAAETLSGQLGQEVAFDERGRRALSWAPQRSEDLAAWLRQSVEETGRLVVEHGEELAWGAAATAGAVLLTYGLASYLLEGKRAGPAFAVLNVAEEVGRQGAELAEALRDDALATRANLFAGDQSYSAAQAGQGEAWRQAKDKGLLPETVKRYWVTRDDRRVCPVCEGLHGQKRGLDEPFNSPADGESYANAGPYGGPHDGCRCALLLVGLQG